jgi:hypothetical protein
MNFLSLILAEVNFMKHSTKQFGTNGIGHHGTLSPHNLTRGRPNGLGH